MREERMQVQRRDDLPIFGSYDDQVAIAQIGDIRVRPVRREADRMRLRSGRQRDGLRCSPIPCRILISSVFWAVTRISPSSAAALESSVEATVAEPVQAPRGPGTRSLATMTPAGYPESSLLYQ